MANYFHVLVDIVRMIIILLRNNALPYCATLFIILKISNYVSVVLAIFLHHGCELVR